MNTWVLFAALIAGLASSTPVNDYGATPTSTGYGKTEYETKCTPYYENEVHEKCEHYHEKVCYTTQKDNCREIDDQVCRGIVTGRQYRKCFNVTEMLCGLKEDIRYDVVQAVFTVQKCHKTTERVCDTVYETQFTNKNDYQCITVTAPQCHAQEKTVIDKTCKTTYKFDCPTYDQYQDTQSEYGSSQSEYGSSMTSGGGDSYGADSYGGDKSYGEDSYEQQSYEPKCKKKQEYKCYTTPRYVTSQVCERSEEKVCEKMNEKVPIPSEKQVCHDEEKKVCDLEQRQQPKQIKRYVYTKQCRAVERRICENADAKQLVPSCVPTTRKECHYTPVEKCEQVPKKHCYKINRRIKKERCETSPKKTYPEPSYNEQPAYSAGGTDSYSSGNEYQQQKTDY